MVIPRILLADRGLKAAATASRPTMASVTAQASRAIATRASWRLRDGGDAVGGRRHRQGGSLAFLQRATIAGRCRRAPFDGGMARQIAPPK